MGFFFCLVVVLDLLLLLLLLLAASAVESFFLGLSLDLRLMRSSAVTSSAYSTSMLDFFRGMIMFANVFGIWVLIAWMECDGWL